MPVLHDPTAIAIGPLDIRWYALFILAGIFAAVFYSHRLAQQRLGSGSFLLDIATPVIVCGIVGARTYYVLLEWDYFIDHPMQAFNVRSGGMTIHGAIAGGLIALVVLCKRHRQSLLVWIDLIVPGVALGQAIGRWGNWANQEAFGTPTDVPWAVTIDPDRRPAGYEQFATFHPTFLYESVLNLVNALILGWLVLQIPKHAKLRNGDVAGIYLLVYGVVRLLIERVRTDSLYIGALPAAYWLSFAMIAAGVALLVAPRYGDMKS